MTQRFNLDDIAYFQDDVDKEICYGTVVGMCRNRTSNDIQLTIDDVKSTADTNRRKYLHATVNANKCYATVDELNKAIEIEERAACDIYRWQINSIDDLIRFALNNDVSGKSFRIECDEPEVADEIRRKRIVFIEKAQALLGLTGLPVDFPE